MNRNFARTISLLRHERGLSQKAAAADLGISQALLSHYEKGIRECGMDFVVRLADYYNVTTDYLLGRTSHRQPEDARPEGTPAELPQEDPYEEEKSRILTAITVVFSLLLQVRHPKAAGLALEALTLAVYRVLRALYCLNGRGGPRIHRIPEAQAESTAAAAEALALQRLRRIAAAGRGESLFLSKGYALSPENLAEEFPGQGESLLELTETAENRLLELLQPE